MYNLKKQFYSMVKKVVEKSIIKSANTTSSFLAHQPSAPKSIEKFKKK